MITFTCEGKGCSPRRWEGELEIVFWRAIFPIFIVMIP